MASFISVIFFVLIIYPVYSQNQSCASGWTPYGNELFLVTQTEETDFAHARAACQNNGGDLAVIKSREQYHFLVELLPAENAFYWIGLTGLATNGTWRWVDGSYFDPTLPVWATDQPNGGERCMVLVSDPTGPGWDHKWADYGCYREGVRFICARDFGLSQPPTLQETGTNHVVVAWQPWQDMTDSGEGPTSGYRIYFRLATREEDSTSWTLAGYRAEQDAVADDGGESVVFNLTGLESSTEYEIAITVIHLCTGREGNIGPSLAVVTRSLPITTYRNPITPWALFGVSLVFNVLCGIIITALCLRRKRPNPSRPVNGTSRTSGPFKNPTFNKEENQNEDYCQVTYSN